VSTSPEFPTGDSSIRPLELHIDEEVLDDLRDRLDRTRWPEPETVAGPRGTAD
jgi:epoxide hydrolase